MICYGTAMGHALHYIMLTESTFVFGPAMSIPKKITVVRIQLKSSTDLNMSDPATYKLLLQKASVFQNHRILQKCEQHMTF